MKIRDLVNDKGLRFRILDAFHWVPDIIWLKILFRIKNGYWMDFKHPKTFNEKIQWLKVYDDKSDYIQMVDKYLVKEFVSNKIGNKYIIPTIGVWDSPEDIEWELLPPRFVLKTTHGGGGCGVVVCKDKHLLDKKNAINELKKSMSFTAGNSFREHPYMGVKKRVIAEELLEVQDYDDLPDYKFYCFNGEPFYCQVIRDRRSCEKIDFYDMSWKHQDFIGLNPNAIHGSTPVERPETLEEMKRICKVLAKDIPFVRIDLYDVNKKVYFGEITFYPASGFGLFSPIEWNEKLGNLIKIS